MKTKAEMAKWMKRNGHELEECGRCGETGIPEDAADAGDEEYMEILSKQTDPDSQYNDSLLCGDCLIEDDIEIDNQQGRGYGYFPADREV